MAQERRRFTTEIKKRVALEALCEQDTVQRIAERHGVHPNQVSTWKRQAVEGLSGVFKVGGHEREVFGCLFLNTRNRLIRDQELFYGSLDRTTVHPRVILEKALKHNAGAIIAYHNHPSSVAESSASDMSLTGRVKDLLDEIDVRLLDHIVVSRTETVSMAARGLI